MDEKNNNNGQMTSHNKDLKWMQETKKKEQMQ